MCIIAVCNRELTIGEFYNCWDNNPDGFGMAWPEKQGKLLTAHIHKGVMRRGVGYAVYCAMLSEYGVNSHICHFRYSSAGKKCASLTHPFIISSKIDENDDESREYDDMEKDFVTSDPVLFHNGHFSDWQSVYLNCKIMGIKTGETVSDTKILALLIGKVVEKYGLDQIEKILSVLDDKFAVLHNNRITTYGYFVKSDDGKVKFSNNTFEDRRKCYDYTGFEDFDKLYEAEIIK